ncbi:MAG TPA: AMP-binding protein [Propionibacterium sp.]|nr:AMP-binding protein [Propionibacterium sp.]
MTQLRARLAPPARTLVDVFRSTVTAYGEAHALDNGVDVLSYDEFAHAAEEVATDLAAHGIGRGDRVGVRIASGTTDLYVAIMGILLAGAAYVPVDADDPDERARTVFDEAQVAAILGNGLEASLRGPRRPAVEPLPDVQLDDDAWIIFTSGSTGKPKGVAVRHRSAAAFVDAESRLFLQHAPINETDRVMAGLSVAFDASCEEMWLAWRYGACLVPAPRSLVRSGMDLGPWLVAHRLTIVSTVPTLVLLWPPEALDRVRLLILGGEACPPEIGIRFATERREVWNTYGPTEATVVACAAQVFAHEPVRIGWALDGWDLAVVDPETSQPAAPGEPGELVIGGVGLARYLDPAKDAEKYAPMPSLGWERAYRSGDLVVDDPEGLLFLGRADDQVKVGGRRIELGELDAALTALPGVRGAAAAVRTTGAGTQLLVGYLAADPGFDTHAATASLREQLPAALVPRLAVVDDLPTRTSGKIDRDALPWPLPGTPGPGTSEPAASGATLGGDEAWLAGLWTDTLGADVADPTADFFDLGGTSLAVAHLLAGIRRRFPEAGVTDIYDHPRLGAMAAHLVAMEAPDVPLNERVEPVRRRAKVAQLLAIVPLRTIGALRWLTYLATAVNLAGRLALPVPTVPWWLVTLGWALLVLPPGRMALAALGARAILAPVVPGRYPRGGRAHLRLWLAERLAEELGAASNASAPGMVWYARLLGARIGRGVDLHTVPPVTGHLSVGDGASVEIEADLAGYWLDGDTLVVGRVEIGPDARIGMRSTLGPDSLVGAGAEIGPGSAVVGEVPAGEYWTGSPAQPTKRQARGPWEAPPPRRPVWWFGYLAVSLAIAAIPVLGLAIGTAVVLTGAPVGAGLGALLGRALVWLPLAVLAGFALVALLVLAFVRLAGLFVVEGPVPVHSGRGLAAWATVRVLDEARTWLYPIYAGWFTTVWLRLLGAEMGKDAEASTVLMIPKLASVGAGAFLADDTLVGGYELGGGWLRTARTRVGKGAFLGNSGMAAPGRKVPARGLVAVLSSAPPRDRAKKTSSWIGSPPAPLRRAVQEGDTSLTYDPPARLRVLRAVVEAFRIVAVMVSMALAVLVVAALLALASVSWGLAAALGGVVLVGAGYAAAWLSVLPKRLLVGRVQPGEHPLWSSFVWRNELADQFVELVTAPWFVRWATGTPLLNVWLRTMGARIGPGVWCESYWLPEPDLVEVGPGATISRGCVVQTHLFHDRVLALDTVVVKAGATLAPNSVTLPGSTVGRHATIGPASLVMRGESVPRRTRWIGNPIGPWAA